MGCAGSKQAVDVKPSKPVRDKKDNSKPAPSKSDKQQSPAAQYGIIDEHARKAPRELRKSPDGLVNYLSTKSKDPKMLVRAIFVWISENIRYDVEGYFGRAQEAPCGAEDVMICGRSVCEGYANVTELLCRTANIPVKKISGYAKGFGSSADNPVTTSEQTDHAWNAVQLGDKWHLLDSTWGAGHLNTSNEFQKQFNEHYFLTDPAEFITDHFPYMDDNMEASMKLQLLKKPTTLEEYNKALKFYPSAFQLKVKPTTHHNGMIEMKVEEEFSFKWYGEEIAFMETLYHKQGSLLHSQPLSCFGSVLNGAYTVKVHPKVTGTFHLEIFGKKASEPTDKTYDLLFTYVIKCQKASGDNFEYPHIFPHAHMHKVTLVEPMKSRLPAKRSVRFCLKSSLLKRVMINQTFLTKSGNTFEAEVKTGQSGTSMGVYGSQADDGMLDGLYQYEIA